MRLKFIINIIGVTDFFSREEDVDTDSILIRVLKAK